MAYSSSYGRRAEQMPTWLKWGLFALLLLLLYKLWSLFKGGITAGISAAQSIGNSAQVSGINSALSIYGISGVRADAVTKISDEIYSSVHDYFFGLMEDEDSVISAINSLHSVSEATALASIYEANYNKSLWSDIDDSLTSYQQEDITPSYLIAIKNY